MKRRTNCIGIIVVVLLFVVGCETSKKIEKTLKSDRVAVDVTKDTVYRPNFHFTPKANWMNDPNGLFYLNGTYHLFFQYYPEGNVWGPMHWGHATSKDMVTWEEQPIALFPDEKGYIFSGSAVVDFNNTSGFATNGETPVVAMFTYHDPVKEKEGAVDYQSQALAYSLDEGKTWIKYKDNPVIKNPGIKDFRDPKMFWDAIHNQWVMVLAVLDRTYIYTSSNLIDWSKQSEFGLGIGKHNGVWECPDFFPMQVEGSSEVKWVLIQSLNPGGYNGGSGTQYFIGDFDGKIFTPIDQMKNLPEDHTYWIDYGKDNYAGVTWSNIPDADGRKLFIGWMSNWLYAQEVPTEAWRSAMTVARSIHLKKTEDTYRIFSKPVEELDAYKNTEIKKEPVAVTTNTNLFNKDDASLDKAILSFKIPDFEKKDVAFSFSNKIGDSIIFGYKTSNNRFYIDRSKAGKIEFNKEFGNHVSTGPRRATETYLPVTIILDKTSMEIFYDHGETVMTEIFFFQEPVTDFNVLQTKSTYTVEGISLNPLTFD